jgi:hypothetical protein
MACALWAHAPLYVERIGLSPPDPGFHDKTSMHRRALTPCAEAGAARASLADNLNQQGGL